MDSMDPRDLSPVMMVVLIAFVSMGVLVFGMLVSMFAWPIGIALFAVGGIGVVTSPVIGFGLWRAIDEGYVLTE